MSSSRVAVLLLAHGSPEDLADMSDYLRMIRRGRDPEPELVAEMSRRYALVPGGRSPLLERTREQARALEEELSAEGWPVRVGMRFWKPFVIEAVQEILAIDPKPTRIVGLPMAPQFSPLSVGAYEQCVRDAVEEIGEELDLRVASGWNLNKDFVGALADRLQECLASGEADAVVFTAHSLPQRVLAERDPYPDQFGATARAVAAAAGVEDWHWAFQSAGATDEPWLGPDVSECIAELADAGVRRVIVQPVGFVCDHVEILYDIDIAVVAKAKELGVEVRRPESLNTHPRFIRGLADVIRRRGRDE